MRMHLERVWETSPSILKGYEKGLSLRFVTCMGVTYVEIHSGPFVDSSWTVRGGFCADFRRGRLWF